MMKMKMLIICLGLGVAFESYAEVVATTTEVVEQTQEMTKSDIDNREPVDPTLDLESIRSKQHYKFEDEKDGFKVTFDLTGFDKDKIDIKVLEHSITFSGEYSEKEVQFNEDKSIRTEILESINLEIPLPIIAVAKKAQTTMEGNNLVIKIPRE